MTNSPKASVLLPVYSAERYLEQAARSVLGQTFRDFELLFLNDGSRDGSAEIMARLAAEDARCRVLSWPNRGLVATLNAGIEGARGGIILRMDADDVCRPDRFARQIAYLDAHPECVAVGSRVLLIDPDGLPIMDLGRDSDHAAIDAGNLAGGGSMICHPSVAIRASALKAAGGYRKEYEFAEDLDLFLRLAELGRLANLPEVLLQYRQHSASIGYAKREAQLNAVSAAISDALHRRSGDASPSGMVAASPSDVPTRAGIHRMWSWWALGAGNVATARKHAGKALQADALDWRNWKLFLCAVRGY